MLAGSDPVVRNGWIYGYDAEGDSAGSDVDGNGSVDGI